MTQTKWKMKHFYCCKWRPDTRVHINKGSTVHKMTTGAHEQQTTSSGLSSLWAHLHKCGVKNSTENHSDLYGWVLCPEYFTGHFSKPDLFCEGFCLSYLSYFLIQLGSVLGRLVKHFAIVVVLIKGKFTLRSCSILEKSAFSCNMRS